MLRASRSRVLALAVALAMGAGIVAAAYHLSRIAPIGTAYAAKTLCSGVFVSGRDPQSVIDEDIMAGVHPLLRFVSPEIDRSRRRASARFLGFALRQAQFRPSMGCTLAIGATVDELASQRAHVVDATPVEPLRSSATEPSIDAARLRAAIDTAFAEPDPRGLRRTRAVIVVHRGKIVAERYAPGFGPDTPQIGWSMTKSVTAR